jgi:hypothetical protein
MTLSATVAQRSVGVKTDVNVEKKLLIGIA